MQSTAADVDAYLAEVPAARREVMSAIRQLCHAHLAGFEESMQYGMPTYTRDGEVGFAFASQKQYISLYGLASADREPLRALFSGAKLGKGCIRYTKPEKIDLNAVAQVLQVIGDG